MYNPRDKVSIDTSSLFKIVISCFKPMIQMRNPFFLFCFLFSVHLSASHLAGGELTWQCQSNGTYQFTLVLYRDCGGISLPTSSQQITTSYGDTLTCSFIGVTTISSSSYIGSTSCAGSSPGSGILEKYTYRSGDISLIGAPPASGWHFTWNSCCRPSTITNIANAGGSGYILQASMYPYVPPGNSAPLSAGSLSTSTCYDNSPNFLYDPFTQACQGTDIAYNLYGYDSDYDSIYFSFAQPLDKIVVDTTVSPPTTSTIGVAWNSGYSTSSPLPSGTGSTAANLSGTGELTFNSAVTGAFAISTKIETWRSSQLIGVVSRDLPLYVKNCTPPTGLCSSSYTSTVPDVDLTAINVNNSLKSVTNVAGDTSAYIINAMVGETVEFKLTSTDAWIHPNCTSQKINFYASGSYVLSSQASLQITSLNPGGVFEYPGINEINFKWVIDSADYYVGSIYNDIKPYDFYFTFRDDESPINRVKTLRVRINVALDPILNLPYNVPKLGLKVYYPLDTLGSNDPSVSGDSSVGRDLSFYNNNWSAGSGYIPKTNRFGVSGGAMSYTQNVVQTPFSGVLGTESRSVSVWIKHKGYSSDPVFFQYGSQLAGKRFSGHVNYNCNGVGVGSAFSTTTNNQALDTNWHHIVYVLDTSQCSGNCSVTDVDVYVDGVMYPNCNVFNGSTAINTLGTFDLQFIFGNSTVADSNRLALDDFGMWNRPLTQDEILDLYSGSTGPKAVADLQVCYYSDDIVSLSWTAPADTGGDFLGFVIYRADSLNDSFRVVDTLFDYVSTYLDTTPYIPANYTVSCAKEPYRYFIKTLDGFGRESNVSDTVRNVVLNYFQFLGSGNEGPAWNRTHSDTVPKEFLVFETQYWSGNWMIIDTARNFQYYSQCVYVDSIEEVLYNCAGFYQKYKVEYANGCFSNVDSIYQEDIYPPVQENEVQNTFTPQNELSISFIESADSSDIAQYLLYYKDSLGYNSNPIDSLERQSYLSSGWNVMLSPSIINAKAELLIVPEDTCGNSELAFNLWSGATTKPVYLDVQYNAGDFQLDWNPREVDSGNVFYSIYEAKFDGAGPGTYTLVSNSLDTSADMSLSDSYENYCYYVSATSSTSNFVMESNRVCVSFVGMAENDFSYNLSPNPSNGSFSVNINSGNQREYSLELRNNVGQVVHRATLVNGDNHVTLDQQLAKGSYILVLKDENSQAVKREVLIMQ